MAASLSFLRQLSTVTRTVCMRCGNAVNRVTGGQKPIHPAVKKFSSSIKSVEETEEPDELYRQVTVEVKGHDKAVLKSYNQFVTMAANELGINLARVFEPPKVITRFSILKSVHIYAKHMVQYEQRTHYNVFELKHLTGSTADTFLEYIQRNLPEGMAMKVTKHRLEKIPDYLQPPKTSSQAGTSSQTVSTGSQATASS